MTASLLDIARQRASDAPLVLRGSSATTDDGTATAFAALRGLLGQGYQLTSNAPQFAHLEAGNIAPLRATAAERAQPPLMPLTMPVAVLGGARNGTPVPQNSRGGHRTGIGELSPRARGALIIGCAGRADWDNFGARARANAVWIGLDGIRAKERADADDTLPQTIRDTTPHGWAPRVRASADTACADNMWPIPLSLLIEGAWAAAIARGVPDGRPWPNDPITGRTVASVPIDRLTAIAAALGEAFPDPVAARVGLRGFWRRQTMGRVNAKVHALMALDPRTATERDTDQFFAYRRLFVGVRTAIDETLALTALLAAEGAPISGADAQRLSEAIERINPALVRWKKAWNMTEPATEQSEDVLRAPVALPPALHRAVDRELLRAATDPQPVTAASLRAATAPPSEARASAPPSRRKM